jgi:hypothetical protein
VSDSGGQRGGGRRREREAVRAAEHYGLLALCAKQPPSLQAGWPGKTHLRVGLTARIADSQHTLRLQCGWACDEQQAVLTRGAAAGPCVCVFRISMLPEDGPRSGGEPPVPPASTVCPALKGRGGKVDPPR